MQTKKQNEDTFEGDQFDPDTYIEQLLCDQKFDLSSLDKCETTFNLLNTFLDELNNTLEVKKLIFQRDLESSIKVSEINIENKKLEKNKLNTEFSELKVMFQKIESDLNLVFGQDVDNPSIEYDFIKGEKIRNFEVEREEIVMTQEIMDHFVQYNSDVLQQHPKLYQLKLPLQKAVQQLYVLNKVAENLKNSDYSKAKQHITRAYGEMQHYLLSEFQEAFYKLNISKIQDQLVYLDQYEMIPKTVLFYIDQTLSDLRIQLISPNLPSHQLFTELQQIYQQILQAFQKSISKIDLATGEKNYFSLPEIFQTYAPQILQQFTSFSFNQIIQPILQIMLAPSISLEVYLQNLAILHQLTQQLVIKIQSIDHNVQTVNLKEISSSYFYAIFEDFIQSYQEKEYQWFCGEIEQNVAKLITELGRRKEGENQKIKKEEISRRLTLMEHILHEESIEKIFSATQLSLQRNDNINKSDARIKQKVRLIEKFLITIGDNLVRTLVDFTSQTVPSLNRKTPVNEKFFEVIPQLNTLVQRVDIICNQYLKDWNEQQSLHDLVQKKEGLINSLEILINKAIQLALASIFINCKRILQLKQNKRDFLKKDLGQQKESTLASQEYVNFLMIYVTKIKKFSSSQIKSSILSSIGEQIISILVDHFSSFQVSLSGSFQLSIDMSSYRKLFFEFDDDQLIKEFNVLEVLTNLFKVSRPQLKKYIEEEPLFKTLSQEVIQGYISKREEKE